jgi:hypothetical protein
MSTSTRLIGELLARWSRLTAALSRRDIPLREKTLWRMLYETAARVAAVVEVGGDEGRTEVFGCLGTGEHFSRQEFVQRVAERAGVDAPQATYLARVVLEVTGEATQGGLMQRLRDSLPQDVRKLVAAGSRGHL